MEVREYHYRDHLISVGSHDHWTGQLSLLLLISLICLADGLGLARLPHPLAELEDVLRELVLAQVVVVVLHLGVVEVVVVGHPAHVAEAAAGGPRHVDVVFGEVLGGGSAVGQLVGVQVVEQLDVAGVALDLELVLAEQEGGREDVVVGVEGGSAAHLHIVDLSLAVLGRLEVGGREVHRDLLGVGSIDPPYAEGEGITSPPLALTFCFTRTHGQQSILQLFICSHKVSNCYKRALQQ